MAAILYRTQCVNGDMNYYKHQCTNQFKPTFVVKVFCFDGKKSTGLMDGRDHNNIKTFYMEYSTVWRAH